MMSLNSNAQLAAMVPTTAISGPGTLFEIHFDPTMTSNTVTAMASAWKLTYSIR
jgi:hypothetical protein